MKLPWVSRERLEEIRRDKDEQIRKLEQELHRIKDLIFLNSFNVQIHDTIITKSEQTHIQSETAEPKEPESEIEAQKEEIKNRLRVVARTRPSQMGAAVAIAKEQMEAIAMQEIHPANQVFAQAKEEVAEDNKQDAYAGIKVNED